MTLDDQLASGILTTVLIATRHVQHRDSPGLTCAHMRAQCVTDFGRYLSRVPDESRLHDVGTLVRGRGRHSYVVPSGRGTRLRGVGNPEHGTGCLAGQPVRPETARRSRWEPTSSCPVQYLAWLENGSAQASGKDGKRGRAGSLSTGALCPVRFLCCLARNRCNFAEHPHELEELGGILVRSRRA